MPFKDTMLAFNRDIDKCIATIDRIDEKLISNPEREYSLRMMQSRDLVENLLTELVRRQWEIADREMGDPNP